MFAPKTRSRLRANSPSQGRFGFVEKENRPGNPCGQSPELRKRLVDARAHSRLVEHKHSKALQDLKVETMISAAIQKKENEHLKTENTKLVDKVTGVAKQIRHRDDLICNLKERIAAMTRQPRRMHGRRLNVLDESSCLSVCSLDESRIEERRSVSREPERVCVNREPERGTSRSREPERASASREPDGEREPFWEEPRRFAPAPMALGARTQVTPGSQERASQERSVAFDSSLQTYVVPPTQRRAWTAPKDSPEPPSRMNDTPMSDMSVEKHVDRVNERLHALLQTGSEALHPPALDGDETMRTDASRPDVSELHSVLVPLSDALFERAELIPFLERTSEDLRDAEEAVRGLDQDLEALSDGTIAAEVNTLRGDNNALRGQLEELMDRMLAGADVVRQCIPDGSLTARSSSTHTASPALRARSMSPPCPPPLRRPSQASHVPHPPRVPSTSRLSVRSPRLEEPPLVRRGVNGQTFLKVGETRTERWVMLPQERAKPLLAVR